MATASEITAFIKKLGKLAVNECNARITANKGFVLPSVCIAQSAVETGWGTAGIMVKANAFFGIKAGGSWTGKVYRADTWEVADGSAYNTTANFRAYDSLEDSVKDYFDLIANNSRYSNALSYGTNKSAWKTPKECISAIWSGGYATDTLYVQKVMNTITARSLTDYDDLITGEGELSDSIIYTFTKSDFVQGCYTLEDSGRSVEINDSYTLAVAVALDNFINYGDEQRTFTFTCNYGDDYYIYSAYYDNESAYYNTETNLNDVGAITLDQNVSYGFDVHTKGKLVSITPDELPDDFTITLTYEIVLPEGEETAESVIAYFVKIE